VLLWHPGPARDDLSHAAMAPVRHATWSVALIDAVGYATAAVALSITVCLLARPRGARWAAAGAVLTVLGGITCATGNYAYGALGWYSSATATDALPADTGAKLMTYIKNNPGHMATPEIAGFLALNLGVLLLAAALWRSRSVPRWLPITTGVLTVGQFTDLPNPILDMEQTTLMATFATLAWLLARAPARQCASVIPEVQMFRSVRMRRLQRSLSTAVALASLGVLSTISPAAASASQPAPISIDTTKQIHSASGTWSSGGFINSTGTLVTTAFAEHSARPGFVVTHVSYDFSDAAGSFDLSAEIRETETSPGVFTDDGIWQIGGGTGAYATLQGTGTVTGIVDHQANLVHRVYQGNAHD
jgi:hypothetical protein